MLLRPQRNPLIVFQSRLRGGRIPRSVCVTKCVYHWPCGDAHVRFQATGAKKSSLSESVSIMGAGSVAQQGALDCLLSVCNISGSPAGVQQGASQQAGAERGRETGSTLRHTLFPPPCPPQIQTLMQRRPQNPQVCAPTHLRIAAAAGGQGRSRAHSQRKLCRLLVALQDKVSHRVLLGAGVLQGGEWRQGQAVLGRSRGRRRGGMVLGRSRDNSPQRQLECLGWS